jgi:hypothetical protein
MARSDAAELKKKIVDLLELFYSDEPAGQQVRLRALLKAKLFDKGYCIFDTVSMREEDWTELGVVGRSNANICRQLAALRESPPTRNKVTGFFDDEPAAKRGAGSSGSAGGQADPWSGSGSWRSAALGLPGVPPPPPLQSLPPPPAAPPVPAGGPGTIAAATLAAYHGRGAVTLLCNTEACDHHGTPDGNVWKQNALREYELRNTDDVWDAKMIERAMQGVQASKSVPGELHRLWHWYNEPGFFWGGNMADKNECLLFMRGYWPTNKTTRYLEIGCLKCGHRSNRIYPWGAASARGVQSGAMELQMVMDGLFMRD